MSPYNAAKGGVTNFTKAAALDNGGRDNVTVIVVDVTRAPTVDDVDRTVPRTTLRDEETRRS